MRVEGLAFRIQCCIWEVDGLYSTGKREQHGRFKNHLFLKTKARIWP
jgi:hypothetical protein